MEAEPFNPELAIARYRELEALLNLELLNRSDWQEQRARGEYGWLRKSRHFLAQEKLMTEADRNGYSIVDYEDENGNPIYGIEKKEE